MRRDRWIWATAAATFATVGVILVGVLRHGQASAVDGYTTETGGRAAALAFLAVGALPWFVTRLDLRVPRWLAWVAAALSFGLTTALWMLVHWGFDGAAWSLYGGLQVLRGRREFSDLSWNINWLDCDLCSEWDPHYGPTLALLNPLTGSTIAPSWVIPLGLLLAAAASVGLVWMFRLSGERGRVALLIAAFSPAWLLLLDRANFDILVVLTVLFGAWLIRRRDTMTSWSVFAALIWVNGTLKYYPFAVGIALLPAIRLRRGWVLLVGFLLAAVAYMGFAWGDFRDSAAWNEMHVVLWDFPAYGRFIVIDRLVGLYAASPTALWATSALVALVVLFSVVWGWTWAGSVPSRSVVLPVLALGGSAVFLASVLVGGFGAGYKGAFLALALPILALPGKARSRPALYTSIVSLLLAVIALTVAYNSLLSTLAGLVVAGVASGAGLALVLRHIRANQGVANA